MRSKSRVWQCVRKLEKYNEDWIKFCDQKQAFDNAKLWYSVLYYERYHQRIVDEYNYRLSKVYH